MCTACDAGYTTAASAQTSNTCSVCASGYYSSDGYGSAVETGCIRCDANANGDCGTSASGGNNSAGTCKSGFGGSAASGGSDATTSALVADDISSVSGDLKLREMVANGISVTDSADLVDGTFTNIALFGSSHGKGALATVVVSSRSCLLYTSPSPRDGLLSRMPSSA